MKKQTKLQILKGLVNDSVLERVKLCRYGVQAYNIVKGEEYAVIAAFAKQGGRYYFIDREGRRFLASHYDRAEWLAGEVLEVLADDKAAVSETVDQLERSGSVLVCADFLALFFEECDRRNLTVKSTATGVDELERMFTRYDLVKDAEPAKMEDNDNDSDNNDPQSFKDEQTAAEPSALAQKVAKAAESVKACAAKARALRPALVLYVWGVIIAALFALCFVALPFVCVLVPYIFITAPTFKPTDIFFIISLEAIFIAAGVAIWHMFKNGDLYCSWHDCEILTRPF